MVTFTTASIYWRPLVPRITIKSIDAGTTYYTYDPWTDAGTTTKPISCSLELSQNHQGVFTVGIEDETKALNANIGLNSRVTIECGKQSTQMTTLMSGLVRDDGYGRGADKKVVRILSGSSTAIRHNERLSYFVQEARKLAQDNLTIDITDPNMKADTLLQSLLTNTGNNPQLFTLANDVFNASGIATSSDVESFIASIAVELAECQDGINTIEDASGGEVSVDTSDVVQFRHTLQPASTVAGRGFTIKNKPGTTDNADDTMYLRGKGWDYSISCMKSNDYSNDVWGILPTQNAPSIMEDLGWRQPPTGYTSSTAAETAQKFRPTHNRYLPGDIFIVGSQWTTAATGGNNWDHWFRICKDNAGVPMNAGGIVANILFRYRVWPDTVQGSGVTAATVGLYRLTSDSLFYNSALAALPNGFILDTTQNYWLISSNKGMVANWRFSWSSDQVPAVTPETGSLKIHAGGFSTDSAGGSGWVNTSGKTAFAMPRLRSLAWHCYDPKAFNALGQANTTRTSQIISTNLPNIPASIKTQEAMYKYLVNQAYIMARPRANYNLSTVTAPNVPILPGDPLMISDSILGLSVSGSHAVMATCGAMHYSWDQYTAPTVLSVQPVGPITRYR